MSEKEKTSSENTLMVTCLFIFLILLAVIGLIFLYFYNKNYELLMKINELENLNATNGLVNTAEELSATTEEFSESEIEQSIQKFLGLLSASYGDTKRYV